MNPLLDNILRWARVRGLKEGRMQTGRVEGLPNEARDDAQRPQDYGFAAMPVEGEGLKLEVGGHTVIIRLDRLAERPQLAAYEVAVWHKDGHVIKLKSGGLIEATCTTFNVVATSVINLTAPQVNVAGNLGASGNFAVQGTANINGAVTAGSTIVATGNVTGAGISLVAHRHTGVAPGAGNTGTPI